MKSTVENLGPTRVRLAVEMPFDELKPSLDAAYKQIASQVRIPGFRPGKAPARIIDQRVGRGAVLEQAVNDALPKAYSEAVRDTGVRAIGQPEIEVTNLDDGTSLSFTAEVDVRPEVTLPDLENLSVTVDATDVSDDEVEEQFNELRERFATLKGVERSVESGDYVSIDLSAAIDGEEVEGGSAKGLSYEVGSNNLVEGLDEAIVGKSAGDSFTFATTLKSGERAGEQAETTVTVNSVKVKELPQADDEFAQLASEFDTAEELRTDLRGSLERTKAFMQGSQARDKLLEGLVDSVELPLPESAVKADIDWREHDVVHSLGHDDALFDQYLQSQGKTREEFEAELRESAEKSVKAQFILDAVADAKDVQVGDAELTAYLVRQAQRYNVSPQEFANQIVQAGNLPALVADVRRNKALAELLEGATITDTNGVAVDLSQLNADQLAEVVSGEEDEIDAEDESEEN